MATEVTKIVDPGEGAGHDYHSLSLWEAGQQKNLVTADEIAIAKCRATDGDADTTYVEIDGWVTSSTQYIKIWTDPTESYRHPGKWDNTKYRLVTASGAMAIIEKYVRIYGLQVENTEGDWNTGAIKIAIPMPFVTIAYCIITSTVANDVAYGGGLILIGYISSSDSTNFVYNNILYDKPGTYGTAIGIEDYNGTWHIRNNTIYGCALGIYGGSIITFYTKNNLISATHAYYAYNGEPFKDDDTYNDYNSISENTNDPSIGSHGRYNQTFAFVDAANKNFHLASNDTGALGYGLNLYNDAALPFQDDIDGQDRGGAGAPWDIGADEYVSAGIKIPVAIHHYQQAGGL